MLRFGFRRGRPWPGADAQVHLWKTESVVKRPYCMIFSRLLPAGHASICPRQIFGGLDRMSGADATWANRLAVLIAEQETAVFPRDMG